MSQATGSARVVESLAWAAATRDDAAVTEALLEGSDLDGLHGLGHATLVDMFFCWLREIGVLDLLGRLQGVALKRLMIPFDTFVLLHFLRCLARIPSQNALPDLLFAEDDHLGSQGQPGQPTIAHQLRCQASGCCGHRFAAMLYSAGSIRGRGPRRSPRGPNPTMTQDSDEERIIIMGAGGRDFHNFNVAFRDEAKVRVVAFTATQIPNIADRVYPPELAGPNYPHGIPIYPEERLAELIREHKVDQVVFAYSDISHQDVMHQASLVLAAGADFRLLGPERTMVTGQKPVVSIGAARTGAGKSQTTRRVTDVLRQLGHRLVVVRHPMPYGDLKRQVWQRFASYEDLRLQDCTIEEREEYEPHLERGNVVYAGTDYELVRRRAEEEAEVIVWDGGNNDLPFFKPDLHIVVVDPHRPGHELAYHPGEANLRLADVVVINKVDTADLRGLQQVRMSVQRVNPEATVIEAASPIFAENPQALRGKRVLVVEDGPTLTHGEMAYGAGYLLAKRWGAEIVDPHEFAVGSIRETYDAWPTTGAVLPAMGYGEGQIGELEETIRRAGPELVLVATPIDLRKLLSLDIPMQRVRYELQEIGRPTLHDVLEERLGRAH